MDYFNETIFQKTLLDPRVVDAPRHPFGNADQARSFLRPRGNAKLCLTEILMDADAHGIDHMANYETLRFDDYERTF
jgi:hypothetical protein